MPLPQHALSVVEYKDYYNILGVDRSAAGDLFLEVVFKPHRLYRVEGRDVYVDLPVAPWEAALGATVKAPTPEGPVELKIPAGLR